MAWRLMVLPREATGVALPAFAWGADGSTASKSAFLNDALCRVSLVHIHLFDRRGIRK